jgi:hypothetical protein
MFTLTNFKEGLRIWNSARKLKKGFKQYSGDANSICKNIVDDCWNKNDAFFQTSTNNFCQFWSRDFGICAEALVKQGHHEKVFATLDYALARFQKHGRITTTITPDGKPYDFPCYAVDSLPFIIHTIRGLPKKPRVMLLNKYKHFLEEEIDFFFQTVYDPETNLVQQKHFSSMKDYSIRKSSTYDNCVMAMLQRELEELQFHNPLKGLPITQAIQKNLWNGNYFYEDLSKQELITGDANTFPFWTKTFTSKSMFQSCLQSMKNAGLDKPFALKYSPMQEKTTKTLFIEWIAGDYERDNVWMHVGLCYLDVLRQFDKQELTKQLAKYTERIEHHKNFLEVYTNKGEVFKTKLYHTDVGMLWCVKYLELCKN